MHANPKAKIFLSGERGLEETDCFRSFNTFNFKDYADNNKGAFSHLSVFNDSAIAAGTHITVEVEENTSVLLLPVVGSLVYKIDDSAENIVAPAQLQLLYFPRRAHLTVSNRYDTDLINFLQFWIKCRPTGQTPRDQLLAFDLEKRKDELISLPCFDSSASNIGAVCVGKFKGRKEAFYNTRKESGLFVFVIEGAFEVAGRLLEARDGLGLWQHQGDIDLEALSNDAIILLVDLKM